MNHKVFIAHFRLHFFSDLNYFNALYALNDLNDLNDFDDFDDSALFLIRRDRT